MLQYPHTLIHKHTMQLIKIYDTKTKKIRAITPLTARRMLIYTCGPTLYQQAHIGNMRAYVFADTLNRSMRHLGMKPKHVINFTDVGHLTDDADAGEDKVEKQAAKECETAKTITTRLGKLFIQDLKKLNIRTGRYKFPRATQHIREQIQLIQQLEKKGYAYSIKDGVYFNTQAYKGYGALGLPAEEEGNTHARIEQIAEKKHPHDFALWKRTPEGVTRQQEWDSPWGRGFPGWHIECSAMAIKLLGKTIDIHTGGADHIAVHHNNEIAQSEGATGEIFANVWMHVAFLTIKGEKISKSLNNVYTIDDLEQRGYDPVALRYLFLQASYRTPLSFSFAALDSAQTALNRLRKEYATLPFSPFSYISKQHNQEYRRKINISIANDLNTAKVLATVWDIANNSTLKPAEKRDLLYYADRTLGILPKKNKKISNESETTVPEEVQKLLNERNVARKDKNYKIADTLRKEIYNLGYDTVDTGDTSTVIKHPVKKTTNKQKQKS